MCAHNECGFIGQLKYELPKTKGSDSLPPGLTALLEAYKALFEELKGLPPTRAHEHAIPLKPNATPFTIRPY